MAKQNPFRLGNLCCVLVLFVALFTPGSRSVESAGAEFASLPLTRYVPGELLIRFRPETDEQDRLSARTEVGALKQHTFQSGAEHWRLSPGISVEQAMQAMKNDPRVEYAEPNMIGEFTTTEPSDFY